MILCLNTKIQENLLSGSREKCITVGCIDGMAGTNLHKDPKTSVRN